MTPGLGRHARGVSSAPMKLDNGRLRLSASDVSNYLACRHLTRLDRLAAEGRLRPDKAFDVGFENLVARGEHHEANVLTALRADGLEIVEIPSASDDEAAARTRDALQAGAQVVYQGVLRRAADAGGAALLGRPDFLIRAELLPRPPGETDRPRGHEVLDAKLARTAKARAILQSAFYSQLLAELQGQQPRWMHLALGTGDFASFRFSGVGAYERRIRGLLGEVADEPPDEIPPADPYPEPVEHCAICRWSMNCSARRREDDDLSLVAGMTTGQRLALKAIGVRTRRGFAALDRPLELERGSSEALERAQLQARLQVASEDEGQIAHELLDPERDDSGAPVAHRGLLALPKPVVGDLFFDIEGARYYSEDGREFGLQYLFGILDTADRDENGTPKYTQIWAFDRAGEKVAFEQLVDFITARRERNPRLHVYHYNHYEPTSVEQLTTLHKTREEAVGRLMGRFATREEEVDDLFRLGVFVDLYRVVRQGMRIGVESYSIKKLEPLVGYERHVELGDATSHLVAFETALDEGDAQEDRHGQEVVAGYNEDDCRSTLALRDWLEARREVLADTLGHAVPRPVVEEPARAPEDPEITRLRDELLAGVPVDSSDRTEENAAKALLADLLDWHRREAKPGWWRFFRAKTLNSSELVKEREALGELRGGEIVEHVKKSVVCRFYFRPQEHCFDVGDLACDPATGKMWSVWALDEEHGTIDLKIGAANAEPVPTDMIASGPIPTTALRERLRDLGARVIRDGIVGSDPATALLLRRRPTGAFDEAGPLRRLGELADDAAERLVVGLHRSYLPIQGPPGTGKTYTAALVILRLVTEGRTVGVTAPSHAVIHNLLTEVLTHADERGQALRIGQRADDENPFLHTRAQSLSYTKLEDGLRQHEIDIAAGTPWMWAREGFERTIDTLVVDEAGQMSLANVLAIASAAGNLLLLGDPQQLAQPSQGEHPPGADASALEHLLAGRATMPDDAGLFLSETHRMHPALCGFTSEVFYDDRLKGIPPLDRQVLSCASNEPLGPGLHVVEVPHDGNSNCSSEEAAEVAKLVPALLACDWTDKAGCQHAMTVRDVLVVTPYNAQIRAIERALASAGIEGMRVGTVDKFQGREAPVVIYSMATSSADDAPRGMEFLFDLHRLNVATSRARATAIIFASPDLVRVFCRTPRQMVLANALCRAWEWDAFEAGA
jgi:predicted RecB family nuclease